MQKKYDENKALDAALLNEARKENMFFSKELSDIIGTTTQNSVNSDMCVNAVFDKKELMLNYINISKSKNRVKVKARCDCYTAKELLVATPDFLTLSYKGDVISKFQLKNKEFKISVKKINENNYNVRYNIKIKTGDQNGV
jgi:hypothetical protein